MDGSCSWRWWMSGNWHGWLLLLVGMVNELVKQGQAFPSPHWLVSTEWETDATAKQSSVVCLLPLAPWKVPVEEYLKIQRWVGVHVCSWMRSCLQALPLHHRCPQRASAAHVHVCVDWFSPNHYGTGKWFHRWLVKVKVKVKTVQDKVKQARKTTLKTIAIEERTWAQLPWYKRWEGFPMLAWAGGKDGRMSVEGRLVNGMWPAGRVIPELANVLLRLGRLCFLMCIHQRSQGRLLVSETGSLECQLLHHWHCTETISRSLREAFSGL